MLIRLIADAAVDAVGGLRFRCFAMLMLLFTLLPYFATLMPSFPDMLHYANIAITRCCRLRDAATR